MFCYSHVGALPWTVGAARFKALVEARFYNDTRFFRVIPGFMVQFGLSGDPAVSVRVDRYGPRVPASCVLHVPEAQGSLPRGTTHCTYRTHVPASGVPYVPRTVARQVSADWRSRTISDEAVKVSNKPGVTACCDLGLGSGLAGALTAETPEQAATALWCLPKVAC